MLSFLFSAYVFAILLWLLGAITYTAHHASDEVCVMMKLHLSGTPNAWVTNLCPDSSDARAVLQDTMQSANELVGDANTLFEGVS